MKKLVHYILILGFTGVLLFASSDLPRRGNPDNPMHQSESITGTPVAGHYYIEQAYKDTHTPNMVTVVLGDYRSMDTLGEQTVIFTAGIIAILLLRRRNKEEENHD